MLQIAVGIGANILDVLAGLGVEDMGGESSLGVKSVEGRVVDDGLLK